MNWYQKTKWYQKTGVIILFLTIFFPIGLFLMWRYSNWNKIVKGIITGLFVIIVFMNTLGINNKTKDTNSKAIESNADVVESKINNSNEEKDSRFVVKEENTSSAVDELILRAKENAKNITDYDVKEAVKFINDNYNNYWKDNETMQKTIYYGSLLEYAKKDEAKENKTEIDYKIYSLGEDAVEVVKYVYRKAETIDNDSTQSNLKQIKKNLDSIPEEYKK